MQIINHIEIRDGKAYIAGREALKAEMVARMVVDGEYSVQETMEHYELSAGEVHAALAYYYDNRAELDLAREKQGQRIEKYALNASEHLQELRSRKRKE